ncbi:immunoglobulin domain-containing protein [Acanthopleuribacter pedis]|uniref:Ig-like domain-containing protein n=1 Tax=Acanthopleuribacter pedis TaxID=442870 RepID=A0A8J7Q4C8_9BACT|nr:immunoglobulin domain-containing protein [Acanthopleuribacter pedis]MBO1317506.1 hypothetical protein [Acanthopleuribacter pedis]
MYTSFRWLSLVSLLLSPLSAQDFDLFIPDITLGTHVTEGQAVCVQVPVFLRNNTDQVRDFGQVSFDLQLNDPDGIVTGGTGQVLATSVVSTNIFVTGLANPPVPLNQYIQGFSHTCGNLYNGLQEQTLDPLLPTLFLPVGAAANFVIAANQDDRQIFALAFSTSNLNLAARDTGLLSVLQIPIAAPEAGRGLTLRPFGTGNFYTRDGFIQLPFSPLDGAEPNAFFDLKFCEPATAGVNGIPRNDPLTLCAGESIDLTVAVDGQTPTAFQWRRDGTALAGATTAVLTVAEGNNHAGVYDCMVTTPCGTYASSAFTVAAGSIQTSITQQPATTAGCIAGTATFSVGVQTTGAAAVQWFFNDSAIPGETGRTLTLTNLNLGMEGTYHCTVDDNCVTLTSSPAELTLGSTAAEVFPRVQALGVGNVSIIANVTCEGSAPDYAWVNQNTNTAISNAQNLSENPSEFLETTAFVFTLTNTQTQQTAEATALLLVSDNVLMTDPNQDQANNIFDLRLVVSDWGGTDITFDADGDDQITVLDLLYINIGGPFR